ncbi:hypothetical protein [Sulfurimonas sp.]|uniref:hypothetical protein n=1 Tax=Sulfurimonas sp. TaxID=2022749 RepID=UPI0026015001|nr:hypothetical protein [Sulfurimonas sp.]MBW6487480.1 hypothetical protein [Sulfurimonas sp.]
MQTGFNMQIKYLRYIAEVRHIMKNPQNTRDMFLGLWVNGIYGILNDISLVSILITVTSFYGIMTSNKIIRRSKQWVK